MTLRVLHVTDTHLFAEPHARHRDRDTEESLKAVLGRAAAEAWDLALVTGDLVHDGSAPGYRRLAGHLESLGIPALLIPGNHDDPAVMREVLPAGRSTWVHRHVAAPWTLLTLDSHVPGEVGGRLGEAELAFLADALDRGAGPVLIALHHSPVAVGSLWIDGDGLHDNDAFWTVVGGHPRVKGVVWGHIHQAFDARRDHIRLLASPSTGIQFTPGSREFSIDERPPGYRRLLLHPDGDLETAVVRLD